MPTDLSQAVIQAFTAFPTVSALNWSFFLLCWTFCQILLANSSTDQSRRALMSRSKPQSKPDLPTLSSSYFPPMTPHPPPIPIPITPLEPHPVSCPRLTDHVYESRDCVRLTELLCVEVLAYGCPQGSGRLLADVLRCDCGCRYVEILGVAG